MVALLIRKNPKQYNIYQLINCPRKKSGLKKNDYVANIICRRLALDDKQMHLSEASGVLSLGSFICERIKQPGELQSCPTLQLQPIKANKVH